MKRIVVAAILAAAAGLWTEQSMATVSGVTGNLTLANATNPTNGGTGVDPYAFTTLSLTNYLIPYTATSSSGDAGGDYTLANLNDGDVGPVPPNLASDGKYAIVGANNTTLTLNMGSTKTVGSVAIYMGYDNRDNGNYTLKDAADNTVGTWSIS